MKVKVKKGELSKKVANVIKAVPSKVVTPILTNIVFVAKDGKITMAASSAKFGIEEAVEGQVLEEGMVAVDAKILSDFTRKLPEGTAIIQSDQNNSVRISCKRMNVRATGAGDCEQFPFIKKETSGKQVCLTQPEFKDALNGVLYAVKTSETNSMMSCVDIKAENGEMTLTALDGYRIAQRTLGCSGDDAEVKIRCEMLRNILPLLGKDGNMEICIGENKVLMSIGSALVSLQPEDGDYFHVDKMFDMEFPVKTTANKTELKEAADRALVIVKPDGPKNVVSLDITQDAMEISAKSYAGNMEESIEVEKEGEDLKICFNPTYLTELLGNIDDEEVVLQMKNNVSPMLVQGDGFRHLLLPVRAS